MDVYDAFHRSWALVSAGTPEQFNTMTVSWGELGSLWNKEVATVFVRPNRFTFEYMESNDYFTISFYPPEKREALKILGTISGRDTDKVTISGLHPIPCEESVSFKEATTTLLCKKIYRQDLDYEQFPEDIKKRFYSDEPAHRMYIGEIIRVLKGNHE